MTELDVLPPLPEIIAFLESTPEDSWWAGPTFRSDPDADGVVRHCGLSHVFEKWGDRGFDEFEALYSTSYCIGAQVNDKPTKAYPQDTPKARVVAYLKAMLAGDEMTTEQSMEADYAASCAREAESG
jgi:hypothetical protein